MTVKKIKEFFVTLLSGESDVSSRRFVGLAAFFAIVAITIADVVTRIVCVMQGKEEPFPVVSDFMYSGLMTLVLGCFVMTTVTAWKATSAKTDVAKSITESNPTQANAAAAKEVLQSTKPKAE